MRVIVGLGNPGARYVHTRHNVGFLVVDAFAKQHGEQFRRIAKLDADVCEIPAQEFPVLLLMKPHTFMNLSGNPLRALLREKNGFRGPHQLLIVHDDADLPFGEVRTKQKGGTAGHHGMESVQGVFPNADITRVRVGIGRPDDARISLDAYVLQDWSVEQQNTLAPIIEKAIEHIHVWIQNLNSNERQSV